MKHFSLCTSGLLLLAAAGCLQVETRVKLEEDGSAVITERVRFSRTLLDLEDKVGPELKLSPLLEKAAALERMKQMGNGIELVKHEVHDAENGAKESTAVFKIPDINNFTYVSPYLAMRNYPKHTVLKATLFPIYESTWYGRHAGQVAVTFAPASAERDSGRKVEPAKGPTPAEQQVLRDLRPIAADAMKDFRLKLTFESYAPLRFRQYYRFRGSGAGTKSYDLLDFSDKSMDKYSREFLGNEEIMLELLGLQMGGANIVDHVSGHADNLTLPVYHPGGTPEIYFRPSRALFDKYFAGKTIKFDPREGGERPARWEEIGHKPDAAKKDESKKDEDKPDTPKKDAEKKEQPAK